MLVHQPADLARMPRQIGGELGGDHQVDRPAVALGEIEQPPGRGVRQDLLLRVPLERQRHPVGVEAAGPQLVDQLPHQQLGAAADQRHLGLADEHGADCHRESAVMSRAGS